MKKAVTRHHLDGVFVLVLTAVLAACLLGVLLTGAGAYRALTARDQASFDRRTAVQYIAAKVRQADTAGGVFLNDFACTLSADGIGAHGGNDTLFLEETLDGVNYYTRIYYYDGCIRELFTEAGAEVSPADGERVLAARGLAFAQSDGLLTVTAADENGAEAALTLFLRGGSAYPAAEGGAA